MYKVDTSIEDRGTSCSREAGIYRRHILEDRHFSLCVFFTVHLDIIV